MSEVWCHFRWMVDPYLIKSVVIFSQEKTVYSDKSGNRYLLFIRLRDKLMLTIIESLTLSILRS